MGSARCAAAARESSWGSTAKRRARAVDAGWRVLKLAGIEPDGFVAPAYAYTPALRAVLTSKFRWWASLMRLHRPLGDADGDPRELLAPAWGMAGDNPLRRAFSPSLLRVGSLVCGQTMRVDLHPSDLQHTRHMLALEWILGRAGHRREAITYDELALRGQARQRSPKPLCRPCTARG